MLHFIYLVLFAVFISVLMAVFSSGSNRDKVLLGLKSFAQFVGISLVLAWVFYFIPWK